MKNKLIDRYLFNLDGIIMESSYKQFCFNVKLFNSVYVVLCTLPLNGIEIVDYSQYKLCKNIFNRKD